MKKFKTFFAYLLWACLVAVIIQTAKIALYTRLVDYSVKPFEQVIPGASLNILFLGDSTAVGTGSLDRERSTAGWFAAEFPQANIENISQNGLRLSGLPAKLPEASREYYDLIVLQLGANDIIYLTPLKKINSDLRSAIEQLQKLSNHIVILHSGNVGTAPLFIWPLSPILSKRSYAVRDIYKQASIDTKTTYVDLIGLDIDADFLKDTLKYYAGDKLHLSGDGYYVWYKAIRDAMDKAGIKLQ